MAALDGERLDQALEALRLHRSREEDAAVVRLDCQAHAVSECERARFRHHRVIPVLVSRVAPVVRARGPEVRGRGEHALPQPEQDRPGARLPKVEVDGERDRILLQRREVDDMQRA